MIVNHTATLALPVSERFDHLMGSPAAGTTFIEYGDYQCPHCQQAHFVLQRLMMDLRQQMVLVFRHFPLREIHPLAQQAAEAAEAAGAQGRFWEMHDTLFERQPALDDEHLVAYAHELDLDVDRFQLDMARGTYAMRVRQHFISGVRSGVNGTPSFFINGIRYDGAWDVKSLGDAIINSVHVPQPRHFDAGRPRW